MAMKDRTGPQYEVCGDIMDEDWVCFTVPTSKMSYVPEFVLYRVLQLQ